MFWFCGCVVKLFSSNKIYCDICRHCSAQISRFWYWEIALETTPIICPNLGFPTYTADMSKREDSDARAPNFSGSPLSAANMNASFSVSSGMIVCINSVCSSVRRTLDCFTTC